MFRRTAVALAMGLSLAAQAQDFNWRKHEGKSVTFLVNNNPIGNALVKLKPEFEKLTGITVKVDGYQEQQMRQRLVTVMNARSDEVDLFMSLPSREGLQFAKAGWYADLNDLLKSAVAKDYDFKDLSAGMVADATYDGKVMGLPLNVEGPVVYYRKDFFQKCGVPVPKTLAELEAGVVKLKACDANVTPFVSRGLKPAAPFTFSVFLHNHGGSYMKDRKSQLCSPAGSKPTVIGWTLSVSAHSKNKEAAWYFLQWATSRAVQEKMALEGIAPPRASVAGAPEFKKWIDEQPVRRDWIAALNALSQTGISEVGYPIVANPASREPIGQAINELILGQKTVAQACADADAALNALIAKE